MHIVLPPIVWILIMFWYFNRPSRKSPPRARHIKTFVNPPKPVTPIYDGTVLTEEYFYETTGQHSWDLE
jgi:hypothetical protein